MTQLVPGPPLDEPSKLREIVVPELGPEEEQFVQLGGGDGSARLLIGALGQDDCAAYELQGHQIMVAGSDYVRGPKFSLYELGYLNNYDIGWYLAGANLSDVAAMGAQPLGLLSVIRYPKSLEDEDFRSLVQGIRDGCAAVGALNVGGDIGSAERIILSASAFGVVEPGGLLTRRGARPGQVLCLTGPTGLAGAAMRLANATKLDLVEPAVAELLLSKWRRVQPRVAHGRLLAKSHGVSSCLDTSDGLKGAIETLAASSKVGMKVVASQIPIHPAVEVASQVLGQAKFDIVFGDSVDFELVFTVDADEYVSLESSCRNEGIEIYAIGEVTSTPDVQFHDDSGVFGIPGQAWKHV